MFSHHLSERMQRKGQSKSFPWSDLRCSFLTHSLPPPQQSASQTTSILQSSLASTLISVKSSTMELQQNWTSSHWTLPQNMASFFDTILPKLSKSQSTASAIRSFLLPRVGNSIHFRNYWESWKIWNEWNNLRSGQKEKKSSTSEISWMEPKSKATVFTEKRESLIWSFSQNPTTVSGLNRVRLFSHSINTTTRNRKNHDCRKQPLIFIKFPIQLSDQSDSYTSVKPFDLFDAQLNGIIASSEPCALRT